MSERGVAGCIRDGLHVAFKRCWVPFFVVEERCFDVLPAIYNKICSSLNEWGQAEGVSGGWVERGARVLNMLPPIVSSHGLTRAIQCFTFPVIRLTSRV